MLKYFLYKDMVPFVPVGMSADSRAFSSPPLASLRGRSGKATIWMLAAILLFMASPAQALPSFEEVRKSHRISDALLLDRHGAVIHELRVDRQGRRLDWTSLRDVPQFFILAVIFSEDKRFYEHGGVDWKAAGSAALRNLFHQDRRGASTITMQVAALLDKDLRPKKGKRTIGQKWDQMKAARELEKAWTKDQILEVYLNLIPFRGELLGISAASRGLFDKQPQGLDDAESLLLASLIRSPNAPPKAVAQRGCRLSDSVKARAGCEEICSLAEKMLTGSYRVRQTAAFAPHAARMLLKNPGERVVSTLDGPLQRFASDTLRHHVGVLRNQNVHDGAVIVVENKSGDILAYAGGAGPGSDARFVDGIKAKRQAGSTLKPFLYALAFEKRILTPASLLSDSPIDVATSRGIYKPGNYENDFKGMVSVRTALASSLNVPAVRVIGLTGVEPFVQRLRASGFSGLESEDYYGPSLALGSADVSLYELVNAYRTLANGGLWSSLRLIRGKAMKGRRVYSEEAAFLISDILSDRGARSATFGLENSLSTRFWTAVKTGTSKDMRDNWCIGYSQEYTVGVWVGNYSGSPMWNISGITGAAPVWLDMMNRLHSDTPGRQPRRPGDVMTAEVVFAGNLEAPRSEVFTRGTEEAAVILEAGHDTPLISYPADGTIFALDPDIPEGNQRIFFEARGTDSGHRWALDDKAIGDANTTVAWEPRGGSHLLAIVDRRNNVVASVRFEVRGSRTSTFVDR